MLLGQLVRTESELLDERQCRSELRAERRRAPVVDDRLPDFLTEGVRRNCAVGARSERALVEQRGEARKQLTLAGAPLGGAAHDAVELLGERTSEEVRPVEQRLHHPERLGAAPFA